MAADINQTIEVIKNLRERYNAVILAHLYQQAEVQDIADFVGDSLGLSQEAAKTDADVIVFCGVHFMAETAAILSPEKTVLLPEINAGCPMADMVTAEALREKKREYPDAVVVCYVNSSAEVKAESDICCTSANAVKIVRSVPADKRVLFVPDRNLGHYVGIQSGREIIYWDGYCNTHDKLTAEDVKKAMAAHPDATVMVHPECRPEVIELADQVFSTSGMIRFARESDNREFIIGTEMGILHQLYKTAPEKIFHLASDKLVCPNMKATSLEKVKWALEEMQPRIMVPDEIREKALGAVERMIAVK
ncbi:MAG: quinolinate synthase [Firmicutes bacterium HGW-Firmicutes-14]|nr:MAG: quinolinate synthase [Firmicutes bacterium HGW-Firmicutes-14]